MKRIRLGICMNDGQYEERLGKFLMSHYAEQMELFMYTRKEQLAVEEKGKLDALLMSDRPELIRYCCELQNLEPAVLISLGENRDRWEESGEFPKEKVIFVDKYQNVSRIVDEILKAAGADEERVLKKGQAALKAGIYAIYSLCRNEFQLPFALTAGIVFGENEKVLILDLQENSGISRLYDRKGENGIEDLIVMTALGRFSGKRVRSCIGHLNQVDLVYPVRNSENICEAERGIYLKLIQMILQEMDYSIIVVNLESRFSGFFEFLDQCCKVYLLTEKRGPGKEREKEFQKEMEEQGYPLLKEHITAVELSEEEMQENSSLALAERWKWTEPGKMLREDLMGKSGSQDGGKGAEWK